MEATAYDELINKYADMYDLEPAFFRRLIAQESGFDPNAVSPVGAQGLGQVMPATARDPGYGVTPLAAEDLMDPEANIRFSAEYYAAMRDKFGERPLALAAYNAGPGAVLEHGGIPPFKETQDYVAKIMQTDGPTRPRARPTNNEAPTSSLRPKARPDGLGEQEANNKSGDSLSDALQYADLSQLMGAPRYKFNPPGIRQGSRGTGASALKRLGIASLV